MLCVRYCSRKKKCLLICYGQRAFMYIYVCINNKENDINYRIFFFVNKLFENKLYDHYLKISY